MRVLLVALVLLATAPAALADEPAGFREATALEPAASYVAAKPIVVYCSTSAATFADAVISQNAPRTENGGFAAPGSSVAYLATRTCDPLNALLRRRRVDG